MIIPANVQALLAHERGLARHDQRYTLSPLRRLELYDAFGPTFQTASLKERFQMLRAGQHPLTVADRVRARLARLTAEHVMPLWFPSLHEAGLLPGDSVDDREAYALSEMIRLDVAEELQPELNAILERKPVDYNALRSQIAACPISPLTHALFQEVFTIRQQVIDGQRDGLTAIHLDPQLSEYRSMYILPFVALPNHMLQLAGAVLNGTANLDAAVSQMGDIRYIAGNHFGYGEDELPSQAYDVAGAAYEALQQALGLGPFNGLPITPTTTDAELEWEGAAATAAVSAASRIYDETFPTEEFDEARQRAFWLWWLEEAIPAAWVAEPDGAALSAPTMPFRDTVKPTRFYVGINVRFDQ